MSETSTSLEVCLRPLQIGDIEQALNLEKLCYSANIAYKYKEIKFLLEGSLKPEKTGLIAFGCCLRCYRLEKRNSTARSCTTINQKEDLETELVGLIIAQRSIHMQGRRFDKKFQNEPALIITIDIHPNHRRKGYGSLLLKEMLNVLGKDRASTRNCSDEVQLQVAVDNHAAIALYSEFGFKFSQVLEDYYAPQQHAYQMSLKLQNS